MSDTDTDTVVPEEPMVTARLLADIDWEITNSRMMADDLSARALSLKEKAAVMTVARELASQFEGRPLTELKAAAAEKLRDAEADVAVAEAEFERFQERRRDLQGYMRVLRDLPAAEEGKDQS